MFSVINSTTRLRCHLVLDFTLFVGSSTLPLPLRLPSHHAHSNQRIGLNSSREHWLLSAWRFNDVTKKDDVTASVMRANPDFPFRAGLPTVADAAV